jgi:phenylacetate-CoA ligase
MKCWDPRVEEMPIAELQQMQYKLLKSLVYRLYSFSPFYHDRMKEQSVHPDDIHTLSDVKKLPFMFKRDLRDNYPDKIFTATKDDLVRYHVSSGTTGKPTVVGYTQNDLDTWTTSLARALTSLGLGRGDVIQVSYGYGLFTGGLGLHYGAERIGATVLPTSVGNTERQIELMQDLGATAIACTPSYLLHIGEVAEKMGVDLHKDTKLRTGILGAEPWTERMRVRMEEWLGIRAYDIYGTSELSGPMFTEEALPMVRFRIGDITAVNEEVCACGRTHPRVDRIQGRVDDMLIIRGINVFPSQVEYTLMTIPEVGQHFQIVVDRKGALDNMLVRVELNKESFSDKITDLMLVRERVEHKLRNSLNVNANVELVEPGSLPRYEGKSKKVVDRRSL